MLTLKCITVSLAMMLAPLVTAALARGAVTADAADTTTTADRADSLTVRQCVAIARRQSPSLLAAEALRRGAMFDSSAFALNRRPQYSARAGATVAPRGFYDPAITNLGDYEAKLAADWTLADGGARARARTRSALASASARWRVAIEARDSGLEAARLALELIRLAESESARTRSLEWLDGLASLVRGGITAGMRGSADSIRIALERDATIALLEQIRLDTRNATLDLRSLLGRDPDGRLAIRPGADLAERAPVATDSLALLAGAERRPEVALSTVDEQAKRLEVEEARRQNAATAGLSLDAGLAGTDLTRAVPRELEATNPDATFADRLRRDLGASLAVRVQMPLFDRARPLQVRARDAELQAAVLLHRQQSVKERRRAIGLLAEWESAFRRYEAAQLNDARADRNLLKVKSLYSAGAASLLELLDARQLHEDARDRLAEAATAVRWARIQVEDGK